MAKDKKIHITKIAKSFGVHIRTVYRWNERGWIHLNNNYADSSEITPLLRRWRDSYPVVWVREKTHITSRGIYWWRKKGKVHTFTLLGSVRILKSEVEPFLDRRKNYYLVRELAGIMQLSKSTVDHWVREGFIPFEVKEGLRCIKKTDTLSIIQVWKEGGKAGLNKYIRRLRSEMRELEAKKVAEEKINNFVSIDEACRITGLPGWEMLQCFYKKKIKGEIINGQPMINKHAAESFITRVL